jgi:fibronectin-binding autotransporter adhesin
VDGNGSTWTNDRDTYVGVSGSGTVKVTNGGAVTNDGNCYIADDAGSSGAVVVDAAGSKWTNGGNLYVGYVGSGSLQITNGGMVTVADLCIAHIGTSVGSSGTATVGGAGSKWTIGNDLYVGNRGSAVLNVIRGGAVTNKSGHIGSYAGSSGTVTVDGAGSTWSNGSDLYVGESGNGTLNISNGGAVSAAGATYVSGSASAINFGAGGGTLTTTMLYVSPNQLTGAGLISTRGVLGDFDLTCDASGTATAAFGTGGTLSVDLKAGAGELSVGYANTGSLLVKRGANIFSKNAYLGYNTGSSGTATVDGVGSKWTTGDYLYVGKSGDGILNISNGGAVSVTYATYVTNAASSINFGVGGGSLTTGSLYAPGPHLTGAGTINTRGFVGDADLTFDSSGTCSATFGTGGVLNVDMRSSSNCDLGVGYATNGSLAIRNGVSMASNYGYLGYDAGSSGTATVDGAGSKWTTGKDLYVGKSGNGTLNISNGGVVSVTGHTYVSGSASSIDFALGGGSLTAKGIYASPSQLTGAGSINTKGLVGDYNMVFDASNVYSTSFGTAGTMVADMSASSGNGDLGVGYLGAASMSIKNVSIRSGNGVLGYCAGSSGTATVDGAGSGWSAAGLYVGHGGAGTLMITSGGTAGGAGYLGYGTGSSGTATVSGAGSKWATSNLYVGNSGRGTLKIIGGGTVTSSSASAYAYVAYNAGSSGTISVDGAGSIWTNPSNGGTLVYVGNSGNGTVNITNGGAITNSSFGYIGYNAGSSGIMTVDGDGSTWTNTTVLYLGNSGDGTINVTNGGSVANARWFIGFNAGSSGIANIDGPGSIWTNSRDIYVGWSGNGSLCVTNGGSVTSVEYAHIGLTAGSSGTVTVDGAGSTWSNNSSLYVGESGNGILNITNGGTVINSSVYVGTNAGSSGTLTVDGAGSIWGNTNAYLCLGESGNGTMRITNGGHVDSGLAHLGYNAGASGAVTVDGVGSTWNNGGNLAIDMAGSATLVISNGGVVSVGNTTSLSGSAHTINFGPGGGTLTTKMFFVDPTRLTGAGTINTKGIIGDVNLTFDAVGSSSVAFGTGGVLNVDASDANANVDLGVGFSETGSLVVKNGARIYSRDAYLGYHAATTGTATVDGAGSTWTSNGGFYVGKSGNGVLKITGGGAVNSGSLIVGNSGNGTLTIASGGSLSDRSACISSNAGSSGIATIDGAGSKWTNSGDLLVSGAGNTGLKITGGGAVTNASGYIGNGGESSGTATVDGAGSMWTNSYSLYVGYHGKGVLKISNGGVVTSADGFVAGSTGSSGTVTVDGAGSRWTNIDTLHVWGGGGAAVLSITGQGAVSAVSVSVTSTSLLAIDVGRGSSLTVAGGTGTITNYGTVRILAGAGVPVNNSITYSPISAGTWSGTGTCQPVGGTWDVTNHLFKASSVTADVSGSSIALDLASVQRALITCDRGDERDWAVGASFPAAGSASDITFSATAINDGLLDALQDAVGTDREILSGWTLSTTGFTPSANNPIYLSFDVGADYPLGDLRVWHYDGVAWTSCTPIDLTYDGTYASFTVTGLSGYAVTTPEPSAVVLLGIGVLGLLGYTWRCRRT